MGTPEHNDLDYAQESCGLSPLQADFDEEAWWEDGANRKASRVHERNAGVLVLTFAGLLLGCALLKAAIDDQITLRSGTSLASSHRDEVEEPTAQILRPERAHEPMLAAHHGEPELAEPGASPVRSLRDLNRQNERLTSVPVTPNAIVDDEVMNSDLYPRYLSRTIPLMRLPEPRDGKTVRRIAIMTMGFLDKSIDSGTLKPLTRDLFLSDILRERAQENEQRR